MKNELDIFYSNTWDDGLYINRIHINVSKWHINTLTEQHKIAYTVEVLLDSQSIMVFSPGDTAYISNSEITYGMYVYICKQFADIFKVDIDIIKRTYLIFE